MFLILSGAFAVIYLIGTLSAFWALIRVNLFLNKTPAIEDEAALERFKDFVRGDMYHALVIGAILFVGAALGMFLVFQYGLLWLVGVLVANGWIVGLSVILGIFEKKARALSCDTEELTVEHERISKIWVKKLLPNF